ncbi:hypothetical protein F4818DRAFT_76485 [Hypoxylon cercidicola]|nr:hypothetical protein F4818DRAFT_76485 [Hypoxylon cercidicola]
MGIMLRTLLTVAVSATLGLAYPAEPPAPTPAATPCTTGDPVVTAGYTINYAPAIPTIAFQQGYQPEPAWADGHVVGTYTFGVPQPLESGFAYAQFKCQYYCNNMPSAGSFFVNYAPTDGNLGSLCSCYDNILEPESFVSMNQTLVGAWNHICAA